MKEEIIEHNGKRYRVIEELAPVRGSLGGEMKRLGACGFGDRITVSGEIVVSNWNGKPMAQIKIDNQFNDGDRFVELSLNCPVETNIPPRPTFTPMTAGEAAKVPGIAGRWVAAKVGKNDKSKVPLGVAITENGHSWLAYNAEILLIEGVDLP